MYVIGTAGHVDHGKSTLVKALTGIDPDRLKEEKDWEMTIELGFAWFTLPSGREISVVDVPGHERFIKNMLAGVGGIDLAMLIVAADESVMPQTREHLAILDLLQVKRGIVVLTKADTVDEEWADLVRDEVAEALRGTTLDGARMALGLGAHRTGAAGAYGAHRRHARGDGAPRGPWPPAALDRPQLHHARFRDGGDGHAARRGADRGAGGRAAAVGPADGAFGGCSRTSIASRASGRATASR